MSSSSAAGSSTKRKYQIDDSFASLSVKALKKRCKGLKLKVTGKKHVLIERLALKGFEGSADSATCDVLRLRCQLNGLSKTGRKNELIDKLKRHDDDLRDAATAPPAAEKSRFVKLLDETEEKEEEEDGDIDDDSEEDEEEEEEDITSEATKESSPVASEVGKLKVAQLKDALKALGLPLSGTKSQLVARLQIGVPVFKVDSIGDKVHYDYEATNPLTKPLFVVRAVRKCQCIRCHTTILQAMPKVSFKTWQRSQYGSGEITRSYHLECFARFPPRGVVDANALVWEDDTDYQIVCQRFAAERSAGTQRSAP